MVAKISLGNSLYGALVYNGEKINKEKGRLLDTNKIFNDGTGTVNIHRAFEDFKRWMPANSKAEKTMMHISLNPHPDDRLSDVDFAQLAHEYMEKMGFGDMPYLVFKHEDIDRHHIHIVTVNVNEQGKRLNQDFLFRRSKKITTELEEKYNLHKARREKITPDMPIKKVDPNGDIKRQVANAVKMVGMRYKFQTLGEYNAVLSLYNIKCEQTDGRVNGREYHGLVYFATDDEGKTIANPFKASRLGKFASRTAIDSRFEKAKDKIDVAPTRRKVADVLAGATDKEDFTAKLKAQNIDVVLRYTDEGRIYGVTFIDHDTMTVLNGSRLGKQFSANALNERFNNPAGANAETPDATTPVVIPVEDTFTDSGSTTQPQSTANTQQPSSGSQQTTPSQSHDDYSGSDFTLPGLDLFQTGQSFNPDEEEFRRRMQRKKKKRGPRL